MKLGMFSVFDDAVKAFAPPMFMRHRGEAIRSFTLAARDVSGNLHKFSKDYHLYELGDFDDASAKFSFLDPPQRIISAFEVTQDDVS